MVGLVRPDSYLWENAYSAFIPQMKIFLTILAFIYVGSFLGFLLFILFAKKDPSEATSLPETTQKPARRE